MASESSDEGVSVSLPPDLEEWLDRKATVLGVDRGTVLEQLLSSYRAAVELDEDPDAVVGPDEVDAEVRDALDERLPDIAAAVREQLDETGVDSELAAEVDRLEGELDSLRADVDEKIQDVRQRVIQVKRETDGKAPAHHDHQEIEDLTATVADLESTVADLEATVADHDDELSTLTQRLSAVEDDIEWLDEFEERLRTVAWVVSDLKDAQESRSGRRAIDRLKHSAAELDVSRAVCENCSEAVEIALLSEPKCPHCDATVSDIEAGGRIFGKPKLRVARQLESGDEDEHANVPAAAEPEEEK